MKNEDDLKKKPKLRRPQHKTKMKTTTKKIKKEDDLKKNKK